MNVLVVLLLIVPAMGNVNLMISNSEMNRTLGINTELIYVENGVVNAYSTKFPFRVDSHLDHVTFSWSAVGKVRYSVNAHSEDMSVLPVVRIPETGEVPTKAQDFSIEYRCAGHRSGQFVISLFFEFTTQNGKKIPVQLKQEKICASRDGRRGLAGGMDADSEHQVSEDPVQRIFLIIIVGAAAFLLIVASLLFSYFRKSKKETGHCESGTTRFPTSFRTSIRSARSGRSSQPFLTSTPIKPTSSSAAHTLLDTTSVPSTSSVVENSLILDKKSSVDVRKALVALHADRDLFHMLPFVDMEGTFGEVRFAIWRQTEDAPNGDVDDEEDAAGNDEAVLCKTLKKHSTPAHLEKFLAEALSFHNVPPHSNLAQVACAASFGRFDVPSSVADLPLLCYRHRGFGCLKKFLVNCRDGEKRGGHTLRAHELASLCLQVARAVAHLHKHRILHKDIAARNCLVAESGSRLVVQLCDSALSRDLFPSDYHCLGDNENRPIRWMSPEAISSNEMTSGSDVWSLGVLCWEILSLGVTPFADVDPDDLCGALLKGNRLPQPFNCPDQLYNVMFCCWRERPRERPTADHVSSALEQFVVQIKQYI